MQAVHSCNSWLSNMMDLFRNGNVHYRKLGTVFGRPQSFDTRLKVLKFEFIDNIWFLIACPGNDLDQAPQL